MPLPPSSKRACACGCLRTFRSTRAEDRYASKACEELHQGFSNRAPRPRSQQLAVEEAYASGALKLNPREWISGSDLALRLGLSASAISRWASKGFIPCLKIGRCKRFRVEDVRKAMSILGLPRLRFEKNS